MEGLIWVNLLQNHRQRESNKKTTDTSTANITNISTTRTYETSTTNSTTTPLNSVNVTPVTDGNNVTSVIQRDTNHQQSVNMTSINTENEVKMESNSHTEKTESCSLEEVNTKSQEKQSPISSKGKYDLRPSTLVPRDYGEEEEEESAEKKKVEAVIDLTEDDEVEVERKESKPVETKPGLPSKDDSGMRSWRLCHSLSKMSSRTLWLVYSCTYNREQNLIFSTPCYYNFISFTVFKLTNLPPPLPP